MTAPNNMTQIFEKLNDLKEIFKFGEKIVPIIQSIIGFMRDVVPLLESINTSIADSTSQMPKAASQINNVTSATELATTEILDLVDEISNELMSVDGLIQNLLDNYNKKQEIYSKLLSKLNADSEEYTLVKELMGLDELTNELNSAKEKILKINEDTYKITLSLQVQDITAQQLAAVTHLIEQVHTKLASLVDDIDNAEIKDNVADNEMAIAEGVHFDANARYDKSGERQKKADEIIDDQKRQASQEEIDKLFS